MSIGDYEKNFDKNHPFCARVCSTLFATLIIFGVGCLYARPRMQESTESVNNMTAVRIRNSGFLPGNARYSIATPTTVSLVTPTIKKGDQFIKFEQTGNNSWEYAVSDLPMAEEVLIQIPAAYANVTVNKK